MTPRPRPEEPADPGAVEVDDLDDPGDLDDEIRPPAAGTTTNLVVAAVVTGVGAAAVAGSLSLGAGTAARPGPGTWPLLVGGVLLCLGLALAATARSTDDAERFTRSALLVVAGLATMVAFVAVVGTIGFELPAAVLAFLWLRFLGHESWRTSAAIAAASVAVFYALFVGALDVTIPHLF